MLRIPGGVAGGGGGGVFGAIRASLGLSEGSLKGEGEAVRKGKLRSASLELYEGSKAINHWESCAVETQIARRGGEWGI